MYIHIHMFVYIYIYIYIYIYTFMYIFDLYLDRAKEMKSRNYKYTLKKPLLGMRDGKKNQTSEIQARDATWWIDGCETG